MTQTNINIRIDEEVKKEAEHLFAELGLNMTTAVNLFIRQAIRQGGIPFEVTMQVDPFYNPANLRRLQESIKQIERGQGVQKMMQDLEHSNHA